MAGVSDEIYTRMREAYFVKQTIAHVAESAGVTEVTARKYIQVGAPKLGRPPLRETYERELQSRAAAQAKAIVYGLSEASEATLKLVKATKGLLAKQLSEMGALGTRFRDPAAALEKVHRIEMALLGGATDIVKLEGPTQANDPFADATDEEILAFVHAGLKVLTGPTVVLRPPPIHTVASQMEVTDNAAAP